MSVSVKSVRGALVTNIATQVDLTTTQVSQYLLASPTFPAIMVFPSKIEFDLAARRGLDFYTFIVQALVSSSLDQGAQDNLDAMMAPSGTGSIKAALESDRTLGGLVQTLQCNLVDGYQLYKIGASHALGAEWTVEIWASGS